MASEMRGSQPMDAHYSHIRSLNNDLVLFANALMTRNNDVTSIHDFVTDAIRSLSCDHLRKELDSLNERVIQCHSDDDRLRLLVKMQHCLAREALPYLETEVSGAFGNLSERLQLVESLEGTQLKADISRFQIDVLRFIPGLKDKELTPLIEQVEKVAMVSGKALPKQIDALFGDINLLIQPAFDDDLFDDSDM